MKPTSPDGYVSIIGTSYLLPIAKLLESLEALKSRGPNEVQASSLENGYSAAIAILTVLLLESAISRAQYVLGISPPQKPVEFIRKTYPDCDLADQIEELFVLRDVIAHNHVWEAQMYWDEQGQMKLVEADLQTGYGDRKFNKVRNGNKRQTRILDLNLFPTRICRTDAVKVLKSAVDFLLFLENISRNFFYLSPQYVVYNDDHLPFIEIVAELQIER